MRLMFVGLTACLVMATLWVESRAEDLVRVGKGETRPAAQERSAYRLLRNSVPICPSML